MQSILKWLIQGSACGLMLGLTLLAGFSLRPPAAQAQPEIAPPVPQAPDVLRSHGLVIVDEKGQPRISLGVDKGNAYIACLDVNAKPRVIMAQGDNGSGLVISDEKDVMRALLGHGEDENYGLVFQDSGKKMRVMVGQGKDMNGLVLSDASGHPRSILGQTADNPPFMIFQGADGKPNWMAPPMK